MKSDEPNGPGENGKVKRKRNSRQPDKSERACVSIGIERSGDWIPVEELRAEALVAVEARSDVRINLVGIDHLDASALQVLLAVGAEQEKRGQTLELTDASAHLLQWFHYAGATDRFSMTGRNSNE